MCCVLGLLRKDLLADSDLAVVLSWFSRLVRMQICDVEWRHHRNRAASDISGSTRWANFVASFVNGEAKSSQEARARAREEMRAAGHEQESEPVEPTAAGPALDLRPLRTRAARPLEIFREERKCTNVQTCLVSGIANVCLLFTAYQYFANICRSFEIPLVLFSCYCYSKELIQRDRRLNLPFNPCSKHYWDKVKREFAQLDQQTLEDLEQRSQNSAVEAVRGRAAKKQRLRAASAVADLPANEAPSLPLQCYRCRAQQHPRCEHPVADNRLCTAFQQGRNIFAHMAEQGKESAEAYPLTSHMLDKFRSRRSFEKLANQFEQAVSEGPRLPPAGKAFPEKVTYEISCGEICLRTSPPALLALHAAIMQGLRDCAQRFSTCAQLVADDVVPVTTDLISLLWGIQYRI